MKIAVIPGSFDPITLGHVRLIDHAARIFDKIIVVAMINPDKQYLFSIEERRELMERELCHLPNIQVDSFEGMLYDYATKVGADVIVKGLRNSADMSYELEMATFNSAHCKVQTVFLPADVGFESISSTELKKRILEGKNIQNMASDEVIHALKQKINK